MQIKLHHYLGILAAAGIVLANTALSFADNMQVQVISVEASSASTTGDNSSDSTDALAVDPAKEKEDFVKKLQQELNLSKTEYRQVLNNISETQRHLDSVTKQKLSLVQQLQALDDSVNIATKKLIDVVYQEVEAENQIALIYEQIQMKEIALEQQKQALKDYVSLLYQQENSLIDVDKNGEIEALKLLLSDDSVGTNLREFKYFSLLSETGQQMVNKLDQLDKELLDYKERAKRDKIYLQGLQTELAQEKQNLDQQKESKENLMKITSGQEMIYSQLLQQSVREQEQSLSDVKKLSDVYSSVEQKVKDNADFNIDDYRKLLDNKTQVLYDFTVKNTDVNSNGLIWPVTPQERGLSAYFHDSAYKAAFGMEHQAIDIPTFQGTLVRSTADGVVYTTKDNGYGYSYIIVAHAGGFMSVYGHISSILVREGDVVKQGGIIGLSGGMPGTKGAGYMTTGPHLHFEILKNGVHVDPLDYIPIDKLSFDAISKLPTKYLQAWKNATAVSRSTTSSLMDFNLSN